MCTPRRLNTPDATHSKYVTELTSQSTSLGRQPQETGAAHILIEHRRCDRARIACGPTPPPLRGSDGSGAARVLALAGQARFQRTYGASMSQGFISIVAVMG